MAPEGVAMAYPLGAVERAMTVRDVILQAGYGPSGARRDGGCSARPGAVGPGRGLATGELTVPRRM
jgi:hypothetical protein